MINKIHLRFILSLFLLTSIFTVSLPQTGYAQAASQTQLSSDLQSRLAVIEQKIDARRKELGIPGMSLAIVKDGEVIFAKGFGYKDFTKQIPVTADTQFAIGSATKAFTALSVLMSQEEGKLNLDDSPKKYLPYFKINNPETDKDITIRDLLSHSSGLSRTDLAMVSGKLTREELIKVAGEAKPTAKLREKFQYQNIMFTAAGEIVAKVQKDAWEKFVPEKIFKPLGMTNSTMSINEMKKTRDYSLGYDYNFDTKETRNLPFKDINEVAPAGSINSSAKDMTQWLRFMLNGGELNGKRLVSANLFAELTKPQMKITPNGKMNYGLGWFLQEWNGLKVVQHGGNIDGFNSMVAMIPEKKLGFVMLTNVSASSLGGELMSIVWQNILGENKVDESVKLPLKAMEKLVGKYRLEAAGVDIEVKIENESLVMIAPNQPSYTLQRTGERQFKLVGAPDGFAVKFTPAQGDATEMYLQQPNGNYTLPRVNADGTIAKTQTVSTENSAKELIGKYQTPTGKATIEVKEIEGKISLVVPGQTPYALQPKEKDIYSTPPLPDSYAVKVKRDANGRLEGIVLVQPQGEFPLKLIGDEKQVLNDLTGTYKLEQPPNYNIQIARRDGKFFLQIQGQPPYELQEKEKDVYFSPTVPDVLSKIEVKRDAAGNIIKLISSEKSGTYSFNRLSDEKPKISVEEIMAKTIDALGGEANWRKISSREMKFELDFEQQGIKGFGTSYMKAPNLFATDSTFTALGKPIANVFEYFDGTTAGDWSSFSPADTYTGQRLEDIKFDSDIYGLVNWKRGLKSSEIAGMDKLNGEDVYVVVLHPEKANNVTYFISAKTFLPLRKSSVIVSSTSSVKLPYTQIFSDYRAVDGVMFPFKTLSVSPTMGDIVTYIKEVKNNVPIEDKMFKPKK